MRTLAGNVIPMIVTGSSGVSLCAEVNPASCVRPVSGLACATKASMREEGPARRGPEDQTEVTTMLN